MIVLVDLHMFDTAFLLVRHSYMFTVVTYFRIIVRHFSENELPFSLKCGYQANLS